MQLVLNVSQHPRRFPIEEFTGGRHVKIARRSLQQLNSKTVLYALNLPCDRALG